MIRVILVLAAAIAICSCGSKNEGTTTITETQYIDRLQEDSAAVVIAEENEYRLAAGQAPLVPGLTCSLHNLQATTPSVIPASLPAAVATFVYGGTFNQPDSPASNGFNVLPLALQPAYTQWYLVKCQGQVVIVDSNYYLFDLTSDDGSKLYLDGVLLIDNDGNHSAQLRSGSKLLKRGIHTFRLDYMQGPAGNQALILESNGDVLGSEYFYR